MKDGNDSNSPKPEPRPAEAVRTAPVKPIPEGATAISDIGGTPEPSSPPCYLHELPDPVADDKPPEAKPVDELTPEEQMERFERSLKEDDWGHQPC